jgi:hypothetical protein
MEISLHFSVELDDKDRSQGEVQEKERLFSDDQAIRK